MFAEAGVAKSVSSAIPASETPVATSTPSHPMSIRPPLLPLSSPRAPAPTSPSPGPWPGPNYRRAQGRACWSRGAWGRRGSSNGTHGGRHGRGYGSGRGHISRRGHPGYRGQYNPYPRSVVCF